MELFPFLKGYDNKPIPHLLDQEARKVQENDPEVVLVDAINGDHEVGHDADLVAVIDRLLAVVRDRGIDLQSLTDPLIGGADHVALVVQKGMVCSRGNVLGYLGVSAIMDVVSKVDLQLGVLWGDVPSDAFEFSKYYEGH